MMGPAFLQQVRAITFAQTALYLECREQKIMKKVLISVGILVVAVFGYAAAGPFITMHEIKAGIENKDTEKLADYVDFPTLRANMKDGFYSYMVQQGTTEFEGNPFGPLGIALEQKVIEGAVDSSTTPFGLSNLASGRPPLQASDGPQLPEPFKNALYGYDSVNRFSIWVAGDGARKVRFVLTRHGLSWKLSNIVVSGFAQRTPEGGVASGFKSAQPVQDFLKIDAIDTRITENNDTWARYAWKLSISNHSDEPAQFDARIQWQDSDGFVVDEARQYGLSLNAHETQTFTGYELISYPAASRVEQVTANISR